jgi:hypothetical protein
MSQVWNLGFTTGRNQLLEKEKLYILFGTLKRPMTWEIAVLLSVKLSVVETQTRWCIHTLGILSCCETPISPLSSPPHCRADWKIIVVLKCTIQLCPQHGEGQ